MVLLDLPSSLTNIANQRDHYLTQSVSMSMLVNNLSLSIMREGFQSLNPFITNGYIKKPELNLEYKQYGSSFSYFARANYANFDINNNQHLPFNNQRIHQTGKRFITEIGAETLHGFQYFDVSIDGLFLHKKYNLDDKEINTQSTSIPMMEYLNLGWPEFLLTSLNTLESIPWSHFYLRLPIDSNPQDRFE